MYRQIAAHIEARIRSGDLPQGSRLRGERDLAIEWP
ncbi:GntR family transcriptional regulator [Phytoactinopolyspora sp. XMNu-373]|uniref:GntR family transcriptional regulator n=1 Tax=Phytoactinopolyspora mesophila TaxID=2650750 RepID=A0A7K3M538_9ACTN|nr:GntR family transcriptional regulator [Phytoactinopolyspora mesophila]